MAINKTLKPREVARLWGVSLKYVYDLLWAGRLPAQKVGKIWQITAKAAAKHLEEK